MNGVEDADGFRFGHGIPHGLDQSFHGQKPVAESDLSLAPGHIPKIFVRIPEAEIAVSLDQFHEGRGLGLGGRSAFSHLLAGEHDGSGVFAADGHEYRDAQPPGVDAAGLGENAQTGIFKSRSGMGDGFFWGTGLVQIRDGTFGTGADGDHAGPATAGAAPFHHFSSTLAQQIRFEIFRLSKTKHPADQI